MEKKYITLKHLFIEKQKCIGLQFYNDRVLQALVKELPDARWSEEFNMYYVKNFSKNLDAIYKQFRGGGLGEQQLFFLEQELYTQQPCDRR